MNLDAAVAAFRAGNPTPTAERAVLDALIQHPGVLYVLAERRRQIEALGFTADLDDREAPGNLGGAGIALAQHGRLLQTSGSGMAQGAPSRFWPWEASTWRSPITPEDAYVKAASMFIAELDRMGRQGAKEISAIRP